MIQKSILSCVTALMVLAASCAREEPGREKALPQTRAEKIHYVQEQVRAVQRMPLVKLSFGRRDASGCGSSVKDVFIDNNGRIRRYIYDHPCSPAAFHWEERIEYFDEKGNLLQCMFVYFGQPYAGCRGKTLFYRGEPVATDGFCIAGDSLRKIKKPGSGFHLTTDPLRKRYGINAQQIRKGKRLRLMTPRVNDRTVLTTNDVMVRVKPSRSGRKLRFRETPGRGVPQAIRYNEGAHVFSHVTVLGIGPMETISPWGEHAWYRVAIHGSIEGGIPVKGWIFGAFLEPVAR